MCEATQTRAMSIGPPELFLLEQWANSLHLAFGVYPMLVGSVARAERFWRDVDVRMILDPDHFAELTGEPMQLTTMNAVFSLWGRHVTGLPIDFQFQSRAEDHDGIRLALGIRYLSHVHYCDRADCEPNARTCGGGTTDGS